MYNTNFLPQLEEFREYLFGASCIDTGDDSKEASRKRYFHQANIEILECREGINGEWIPNPVQNKLENKVCYNRNYE